MATTFPELLDPAAETRWLRNFVRQLVAPADVDDVVQATWLAAVQRGRGSRGFLAAVARRLAAFAHRSASRRQRRERQAARPARVPATDELVARLEVVREVAAALAELPDPYRATLLQHIQGGQDTASLAAAHGLPEATIRKRLQRARELVRRRLAVRLGADWRRHPGVLVLIGSGPGTAPPPRWMLPSVAAAAVATGAALVGGSSANGWVPGAVAADVAPPASASARAFVGAENAPLARIAVTSTVQDPAPRRGDTHVLLVRVRDATGQPLPGIGVSCGAAELAATDANGCTRCTLAAVPAVPDRVTAYPVRPADRTQWLGAVATGLRARLAAAATPEVTLELTLAPQRSVRGRVVDADGQPVVHAIVALALAEPLDADVWPGNALWAFEDLVKVREGEVVTGEGRCQSCVFTHTGADGAFELGALRDREYVLQALDLHGPRRGVATARPGAGEVEIRLDAGGRRRVQGTVVDPDGKPIRAATVAALMPMLAIGGVADYAVVAAVTADDSGGFDFEVPAAATHVGVRGKGLLPVEVPLAAGRMQVLTDAPRTVAIGRPAGHPEAAAFELCDAGERVLAMFPFGPRFAPMAAQTTGALGEAPVEFAVDRRAAVVRFRDAAGRVVLRQPCRPEVVPAEADGGGR